MVTSLIPWAILGAVIGLVLASVAPEISMRRHLVASLIIILTVVGVVIAEGGLGF